VNGGTGRHGSPWRRGISLATLAIALIVTGLLERHRREADFAQMAWILAPTVGLTQALSGARFEREPGRAFLCRAQRFEIVPACAGLRFAGLAFLCVVIAGAGRLRSAGGALTWLTGAAAVAYATTVIANAVRISAAMWLHEMSTAPPWAHELTGVMVYFTSLCGLYAAAVRAPAPSHARPA